MAHAGSSRGCLESSGSGADGCARTASCCASSLTPSRRPFRLLGSQGAKKLIAGAGTAVTSWWGYGAAVGETASLVAAVAAVGAMAASPGDGAAVSQTLPPLRACRPPSTSDSTAVDIGCEATRSTGGDGAAARGGSSAAAKGGPSCDAAPAAATDNGEWWAARATADAAAANVLAAATPGVEVAGRSGRPRAHAASARASPALVRPLLA